MPPRNIARILTSSVMLDASIAIGNDRGPIFTWMVDRQFPVVEVWHKPRDLRVDAPVATVDRYSIAEPAQDCVTGVGFDRDSVVKLRLDEDRCVRVEKDVAPTARYLIAAEYRQEPRTLLDRLTGVTAVSTRYVLLDRESGKLLYAIESAAYSSDLGMFGPRGNSCEYSAELQGMKQVLRAPADTAPWSNFRE